MARGTGLEQFRPRSSQRRRPGGRVGDDAEATQPGHGELLVLEIDGIEEGDWREPDRSLPRQVCAEEARGHSRAFRARQGTRPPPDSAPWFDAWHGHPGSRPPLAVGGSEAVVLDELRCGGDPAVLAASARDRPVAVPAPRPAAGGGSAVRAPVVRSVGVVRERVGAVRARCRRRGVVARLPVRRWVVLERDPGSDLGGGRSASWWGTFDA